MEVGTQKKISMIIACVAALGGLVAVLGYFENKRDKELKREIMELDKNIKLLELDHKISRNFAGAA